jgi:hypothetical protein
MPQYYLLGYDAVKSGSMFLGNVDKLLTGLHATSQNPVFLTVTDVNI